MILTVCSRKLKLGLVELFHEDLVDILDFLDFSDFVGFLSFLSFPRFFGILVAIDFKGFLDYLSSWVYENSWISRFKYEAS